uniref:hypothetical protein n=1 Tax=Shewanella baltica TaxID=62322 RepID=UPI0040472809
MYKKEKIIFLLLSVTVFSIAFRIHILAFITSIFIISILILNYAMSKRFLLFYVLVFVFYGLYIGIGLLGPEAESNPGRFLMRMTLFYLSSSVFFMIPFYDKKNIINYLKIYTLSSLIYVYVICSYSFLNEYRGYNHLFDPFVGLPVNSPLIAMLATISFLMIFETFQLKSKFSWFLVSLAFFIQIIMSVVYLGSRASFLLMVIYFTFKFFARNKSKVKMVYALSKTLLIILFSAFIILNFSHMDIGLSDIDVDIGGFAERGFNSPRFEMFSNGFDNMINYPFGGLLVNSSSYHGKWFHNMILDIVRVSGFLVMLYWVVILLFTTMLIYINFGSLKTFGSIFITMIIMLNQDLAFDGHYNVMALLFLIIGYNISILIPSPRVKVNI